MAKTRKRSMKKRGGNAESLSLKEVFLLLGKSTTLLTKNVVVETESEDGEGEKHTVSMNEYVAYSLGKEMIDGGTDADSVLTAMKDAGWDFLPDAKFPYYSLRA